MGSPRWSLLAVGLSLFGCNDKAPPPPPAVEAAASQARTPTALPLPLPVVPSDADFPEVTFLPMKLRYRQPPLLVAGAQSMVSGAEPGKSGEQVWGLSLKTVVGLDVVLLELGKDAKHDRKKWLSEFKATAVPGEVVLDAPDAVLKRARIVGKKEDDGAPLLSTSQVDVRTCKRLAEVDYCFDVDSSVELALGRSGLHRDQAVQLVAMVRSLERLDPKK